LKAQAQQAAAPYHHDDCRQQHRGDQTLGKQNNVVGDMDDAPMSSRPLPLSAPLPMVTARRNPRKISRTFQVILDAR
jgi:hypothetical protein